MEIKILCACGTKYKFDVEPVQGQMPWPVKCPTCNADATAKANELIRGTVSTQESSVAVALPVAQPVRISLQRPTQHAPAPAPLAVPEASIETESAVHGRLRSTLPSASAPTTKRFPAVAKTVLTILCLALVVGAAGFKWFKRVRFATRVASAIAAPKEESKSAEEESNLWADDCVVLIVKHTNETEVAEACATFWREKLKKELTITATNELFSEEGQIGIIPARNGYVQIVGGLDWPKAQFEALTQYLSERFNTLGIETRDVDFSGAYVFGVFEEGQKKFRAEMELQGKTLGDLKEVVKTEGDSWALAHGYKPGPEGFQEFSLGDADKITKNLGVKLPNWQESERYLLLAEKGANKAQTRSAEAQTAKKKRPSAR